MSRADQDTLDKLEAKTHLWPIDSTAVPGTECHDQECGEAEETSEPPGQVDGSDGVDVLLNIPGQASAPSSRGPMSRGNNLHNTFYVDCQLTDITFAISLKN